MSEEGNHDVQQDARQEGRQSKKPLILSKDKETFRIERIMLVYTDGRHVHSYVNKQIEDFDSDIFSGMLSAVQSFVSDSFKAAGGKLNTIHYGNMKIVIEKGVQVYVALVMSGNEPEGTREILRKFLIELREKNPWLPKKQWDGNVTTFIDLEPLMEKMFKRLEENAKAKEEEAKKAQTDAVIKEVEPPKKLSEQEIVFRCAIAAELVKFIKKTASQLKKAGMDTTDLEKNIKLALTYIESQNVTKAENFSKTAETLMKEMLKEAAAKGIELPEPEAEEVQVNVNTEALKKQIQDAGSSQIPPSATPQTMQFPHPLSPASSPSAAQSPAVTSFMQFPQPQVNVSPRKMSVPPDADPKRIMKEGTQYLKMQKFDAALEKFDMLLNINPQDAVAWFNKGIIYYYKNRLNEALACYDLSLQINPYDADVWTNRGLVLRKMGRIDEAIQCYDRAIQINPSDATIWNNKAIALKSIGRIEESLACYDSALAANPRDYSLWNNKGVALKNLNRVKEAIACYKKALEINPNYDKAKSNLEIAMMALGEQPE